MAIRSNIADMKDWYGHLKAQRSFESTIEQSNSIAMIEIQT